MPGYWPARRGAARCGLPADNADQFQHNPFVETHRWLALAVVFICRICPSSSHCTASSRLFKRMSRTLRDLSGFVHAEFMKSEPWTIRTMSIRIQFKSNSNAKVVSLSILEYIFRLRFDSSKESLARLYCERFRLIRLLAGSTVTADFHRFSASLRQIMHLSRECTYARARARMRSSKAKEFGRERGARGKAE